MKANTRTHGTPRNWATKVRLTRDELAQILDALANERDPFGEQAGDLEVRISSLVHECDRQWEQQVGLR